MGSLDDLILKLKNIIADAEQQSLTFDEVMPLLEELISSISHELQENL